MELEKAIERAKARDAAEREPEALTEEHHPRPLKIHDCAESGCYATPPEPPTAA